MRSDTSGSTCAAVFKFRRQYPIAGSIADFACIEAKLVVELDGGQHLEHSPEDAARTRRVECNGYRELRFWNGGALVRTVDVLDEILRHPGTAR